jgi:hypothetical protein
MRRRGVPPVYRFDGHGAPQGAQAPAKSSGETARPLDGLIRWLATMATKLTSTTAMYVLRITLFLGA